MPKRQPHPKIPELRHQQIRAALTAKKLAQQPVAVLCHKPGVPNYFLDISAGDGNDIWGGVCEKDDKLVANVQHLQVASTMRRHGLGSTLLKTFVAETMARGAVELWSDHVLNDALSVRARVFGEGLLQFYDAADEEPAFLPLDLEQAKLTNERIFAIDAAHDDGMPIGDLGVYVDLTHANTQGWQRPATLESIEMDVV